MKKIRRNKDLNLVYAISFMDLFAIGLMFPLFSNHLRDLGASHFTVGLLNSFYSGLQVISGPIIGGWSDNRDRKSVLIITLSICSLCYVLLGWTSSLTFIAMLRFILGITKHTQSICKAVITDILPAEERAGAFGTSAAFGSLGFIIGPVLGGHLSELDGGFSYVCLITGLLFIINVGLASVITTQPKEPVVDQNSLLTGIKLEFYKSVTDMADIEWASLWDTFLLRFIFGFSMTMYFSQLSTYLREQFDLSQRHIGYTISSFSVIGTISAFLLHHINAYFYKRDDSCLQRLAHFFMLMTVSMVCLALAPNIWMFLLFLVPFSLSCTFLRIISMELLLKQATHTHRGSLSGTSNSIMSVARFVTPVSSGLVVDKLGGHSALVVSAIPPLIGTIVALRMKSQVSKTKTQ